MPAGDLQLLAEGILLHKAMTEVVQPLQTTWLRQTDSSSSSSNSALTWLDQPYCTPECKHLLQLAASSTHMLQAILKVTQKAGEQLQDRP